MNKWTDVFTPSNDTPQEVAPPAPSGSGAVNWNELMHNAKGTQEKWKLMGAKAIYDQEQQRIRSDNFVQEKNKEIDGVLNMHQPNRNKFFYENLQKTNGALFYSPAIQKQKAADRKEMGLMFHMKRPK